MTMTFLVTGGCGFIGSHLCDLLVSHGHRVRVIDDLSSGSRENLPKQADLLVADVRHAEALGDASRGVDGIFHLAAVASALESVIDWSGTNSINLGGMIRVLEAAKSCHEDGRPVPVVYASSAAVYGEATTFPISENLAAAPLSGYAADKSACELHAYVGTQTFGIPTAGLRLFNVYGPRQDPDSAYSGVISLLLKQACNGGVFSVFGDGSQTRDFIWVEEVAQAFWAAMTVLCKSSADSIIVNVCTGQETSILALVDAVRSVTTENIAVSHTAERLGDIKRSVGDPNAAKALLKFSATVPIHEGLSQLWTRLR